MVRKERKRKNRKDNQNKEIRKLKGKLKRETMKWPRERGYEEGTEEVVVGWLLKFGGFRERLLADDLFLAKLLIECVVIIFTKVFLSSNFFFFFNE